MQKWLLPFAALNNSYTLWDILIIFGIHICQVKKMCCMQNWLLPIAELLSYIPWMNFIEQSLCSIIVIILYLLAGTLSFVLSNIYTRLAVCNSLSFTFRSGICHPSDGYFYTPPPIFIYTRQILYTKKKGLGADSIKVISLCSSKWLFI